MTDLFFYGLSIVCGLIKAEIDCRNIFYVSSTLTVSEDNNKYSRISIIFPKQAFKPLRLKVLLRKKNFKVGGQ